MPDFVARFARWWSDPDPATVGDVLAPDIVLRQPMMPTARGLDAARRSFASLFSAIPDLRATVHTWAENGELVFIEFTLHGTTGGRPIEWRAIDRFTVGEDGLGHERVSYFDPAPIALAGLHPARWPTIARLIGARLRR
jgi:ketosteroid isomerase-like protein